MPLPRNGETPAGTGALESDQLGSGINSNDTEAKNILSAERAAVGGCILARAAARQRVHAIMVTGDLTDPVCRMLDTAMRRMDAERIPVDQITVAAYVDQHQLAVGPHRTHVRSLIQDVVDAAPVPESVPWYAAAVVQASARRQIAAAGAELFRLAELAPLDALKDAVSAQGRLAMAAIARAERAVAG